MSELDLRWSLLLLGAVVVAGVFAFNRLQERSFRRMAERSMPKPGDDVLMDEALSSPRLPAEAPPAPVFSPPSGAVGEAPASAPGLAAPLLELPPAPESPPPLDTFAPPLEPRPAPATTSPELAVDFPALLRAPRPLPQAALDELASLLGGLARTVEVSVMDELRGQWVGLPEMAGGRFTTLRAGLSLADRQGLASAQDLDEFSRTLRAFGARLEAEVMIPDAAPFVARARQLDELCAEVDIAVGLNVVARTGQVFQGASIWALADGAGMRLMPDGQFHAEGDAGAPQFILDNQAAEPFFAETLRTLTTPGITFVLDAPRAAGGLASFDRMVTVVRQFAQSLDGLIVDDNRRGLDEAGLDAVRRTVAEVYARMDAAGIAPGGPLARRLFR